MDSPFIEHTLDNGLRIVIEVMPDVTSAAAGFYARTGARDEPAALAGVSHFLEHMCFKGTSKRTWRQITVDFDAMGSTYNAYTMKDRTFYFGWVPHERLPEQLELAAPIALLAGPVLAEQARAIGQRVHHRPPSRGATDELATRVEDRVGGRLVAEVRPHRRRDPGVEFELGTHGENLIFRGNCRRRPP